MLKEKRKACIRRYIQGGLIEISIIKKAVLSEMNVTEEDLKSTRRFDRVVHAKQIFCYLCVNHTRERLEDIAPLLGYRNHCSPSRNVKTITDLLKVCGNTREQVRRVRSKVYKITFSAV